MGGEKLSKLNQEMLDALEKKEFEFEIKELNEEEGTFKGLLSPYNNIDLGCDRVLPSAGKRNNKKIVPFLLQHTMATEQGELKLLDTKEGIAVEGKLYLDTLENGNPIFPEAFRTYILAKKGKLKLSMGYKTIDFDYTKEKDETVRNLKDFEIMEGSRVTFPMNPKALVSEVKTENMEGGVKMEGKAMGFTDLLKVQEDNDLRWKLQDALNSSFRQLMEDPEMTLDDKLKQLNQNVDDFATAYKTNMTTLMKASAASKVAKKEIEDNIEKKATEIIELKAGAKISKSNKAKLQSMKEILDAMMGAEEEDKTGKKVPDKQEKSETDKLELKAEEAEALKELFKNMKGDVQ